jgi:glutamate 5-kinase
MADIKNAGNEVLIVSSGAIGVGAGKLSLPRPTDTAGKQACAAVGQCELMQLYEKYFLSYGHFVGQILLTRFILEKPDRLHNVKNTTEKLISMGVIPVFNENDSVSTEEIEFGDNDTLSAIVAKVVSADLLVILTDKDGLYTANPDTDPTAKLIPVVESITDDIYALASDKTSALGTGGMKTKLDAAKMATSAGIETAIINGAEPDNLYKLLDGESVGTKFLI